jgi:hypothetical protein
LIICYRYAAPSGAEEGLNPESPTLTAIAAETHIPRYNSLVVPRETLTMLRPNEIMTREKPQPGRKNDAPPKSTTGPEDLSQWISIAGRY